jgi:hypothetical protein
LPKLLFAGLIALAPIVAFAASDVPAAGMIDPATILARRPVIVAHDQFANPDGSAGVTAGGVSGNIRSDIQTKTFSVLGPAGPYPKAPASVGSCARASGTSGCRRDVPPPE